MDSYEVRLHIYSVLELYSENKEVQFFEIGKIFGALLIRDKVEYMKNQNNY